MSSNNESTLRQANIHNNLTFMLADMMETSLMNAESLFERAGFKLQHSDRQNFNAAIKAIRRLKANVNACPVKTQEDFGDSADEMYQFMLLVIDRVGDDPKLMAELYEHIRAYPSRVGVELGEGV